MWNHVTDDEGDENSDDKNGINDDEVYAFSKEKGHNMNQLSE